MKKFLIGREIIVLSTFIEEFVIEAEDSTKAQEKLLSCINNEEYEKFENTSKLTKSYPLAKYAPVRMSAEGPI